MAVTKFIFHVLSVLSLCNRSKAISTSVFIDAVVNGRPINSILPFFSMMFVRSFLLERLYLLNDFADV